MTTRTRSRSRSRSRAHLGAGLVLATLLATPFVPAAAAGEPAPLSAKTRDFDMLHLDLSVRLDWDARGIEGTASYRMTSLVDDLARVRLHLEDMKVTRVTVDGRPAAAVEHVKDELTITLDAPRDEGDAFALVIEYGGTPTSGLWFFRPTEEHPTIPVQAWTQGQGTENRHWIPIYDLPDDRLTTSLTVDAPKDLTLLSNGMPTESTDAGEGRQKQTWKLDRPHPPYIITLVAGKFDVVQRNAAGVPQYDYVPPGWGAWADEVFGRTPDMMAFFQEYTGQKYPWGRYSQVTVWDFLWGGMENTGATTLNMRALHKDGVRPDYSADGLVAHELAHMWFGDLITCRTWNHIWLNEGFATYFTDLWIESHHGADEFAYQRRRSMDAYLGRVDFDAIARQPLPDSPTDCGDMQANPYVKGSSVLHMIRAHVGATEFRDAVRAYVAAARDQSVETPLLQRKLEHATGADLSWVFEDWVHRSGAPRLEVRHEYDAASKTLSLTVEQTQPATDTRPLFRFPVTFEIAPANGETLTRTFEVARRSHTWTVPLAEEPLGVVFDPQDALVATINREQTREEWETLLGHERPIIRFRAARALAGHGVRAVSALAAAVKDDAFHRVREEAARSLGKIGGRDATEVLTRAAEDPDSRVRTAVLEAMGDLPGRWVGATLARHALEDASVYAAAAAAESLGKSKAPGALETLTRVLERESHRNVIRQNAFHGLRHLGDPRGAALAYPYLGYEHGQGVQHRMRNAALDAAVALAPNAKETRDWVVRLVLDPYFRMRNWAAGHATSLGLEEAIPRLEQSAETGLGPGVRDAAKRALEKLKGPEPPEPGTTDEK